MFPADESDNLILQTVMDVQKNENAKNALLIEPVFNFETGEFMEQSGEIQTFSGVNAVKQWIIAFLKTLIDTFYIYKGKNYGTSEKKLIGQKSLYDSGFTTSEIEREIKEGLPLNPAIKSVSEVEISKEGTLLNVDVTAELFNGELIKVSNND